MSEDFVPFGMTDDQAQEYHALVDGVPSWMREPLIDWILKRGAYEDSQWLVGKHWLALQTIVRVDLGIKAADEYVSASNIARRLREAIPLEVLRIADYWVRSIGNVEAPTNRGLEAVLRACGSKWMVGTRNGSPGLVERVPDGVQATVETVIEQSGTAGKILRRAWGHVYGIVPNDSAAYADAVVAVEIAASSVVAPADTTATLGGRLGQMKADGDWRIDLREHRDAPSAEMLLMMIRTLWFGHRDRHGSPDYTDVSHEEAAQAVLLASTLVGWFASGAIKRQP